MAEWNSCSNLVNLPEFIDGKNKYLELLDNKKDPFEFIVKMQYDLQLEMAKKNNKYNKQPNELTTIGDKFDWLRENKQAFDDEYREIIDALPGMNTPEKDRSAVWKRWKSKYEEIRNKTFDDLDENEIVELKFEYIDALHFFINMSFALDITAEEFFVMYYSKNIENYRRIKTGY